jgi:hypothetical protein
VRGAWEELRIRTMGCGDMLAVSGDRPGKAGVRLLPAFDSVWLAYRDHAALLDPRFTARVFPGGGVIRPVVLADSHIVGTWTRRTSRGRLDIAVDLFEDVDEHALHQAVEDVAAIHQCAARLVVRH